MKSTDKPNKNPRNLKEALAGKLTDNEMNHLTTSFDIVGEIAIIEIRPEVRKREKIIAETILEMHKNIKTVCKRDGKHKGRYRTQKLKIIGGRPTKETVHKESRCQLQLDVEKCYFSVRSGTERIRIVNQILERFSKSGKLEKILVMFSGIGPFPVVIAKNAKCQKVVGIEINKIAHKYASRNIILNKSRNVELICGDVRKLIPMMKMKFDRIIMPLPRTAEEFLDTALTVAKKGTIIHLYGFLAEEEFEDYKKKIIEITRKMKKKAKIYGLFKCGQFSPRISRICVDFEIG